jgi:hypothetical protein
MDVPAFGAAASVNDSLIGADSVTLSSVSVAVKSAGGASVVDVFLTTPGVRLGSLSVENVVADVKCRQTPQNPLVYQLARGARCGAVTTAQLASEVAAGAAGHRLTLGAFSAVSFIVNVLDGGTASALPVDALTPTMLDFSMLRAIDMVELRQCVFTLKLQSLPSTSAAQYNAGTQVSTAVGPRPTHVALPMPLSPLLPDSDVGSSWSFTLVSTTMEVTVVTAPTSLPNSGAAVLSVTDGYDFSAATYNLYTTGWTVRVVGLSSLASLASPTAPSYSTVLRIFSRAITGTNSKIAGALMIGCIDFNDAAGASATVVPGGSGGWIDPQMLTTFQSLSPAGFGIALCGAPTTTAAGVTTPAPISPPPANAIRSTSVVTRSESSSLLPLPPPRRPPSSSLAQAGAVGAVGGGGAVLAGAAASTVGAVARTLGVATALSRIAAGWDDCHGQDPEQPPSAVDSPLQLTLGAPPDYVAGTAVGAPIMCVVLAVASGAVSYVGTVVVRAVAAKTERTPSDPTDGENITASTTTPFVRAVEAACAGFLLGAAILTTPAVTAVVIRWHQDADGGDVAVAAAAAVAAVACVALLVALLFACTTAATVCAMSGRFTYVSPSHEGKENESSLKRWLHRPDGEWAAFPVVEASRKGDNIDAKLKGAALDTPSCSSAECGLLPVIDEFRGTRAWFCVADAAVQVALGVAGAAAEFTAPDSGLASCAATAWATCAVLAAYVALLLAARPHRCRSRWLKAAVPNVVLLGLALATAGVVQDAILHQRLPDRDALVGLAVAAQVLGFVQAAYEAAMQVRELIAAWRVGNLLRYLDRHTHSAAAHAAARRHADVCVQAASDASNEHAVALIPLTICGATSMEPQKQNGESSFLDAPTEPDTPWRRRARFLPPRLAPYDAYLEEAWDGGPAREMGPDEAARQRERQAHAHMYWVPTPPPEPGLAVDPFAAAPHAHSRTRTVLTGAGSRVSGSSEANAWDQPAGVRPALDAPSFHTSVAPAKHRRSRTLHATGVQPPDRGAAPTTLLVRNNATGLAVSAFEAESVLASSATPRSYDEREELL